MGLNMPGPSGGHCTVTLAPRLVLRYTTAASAVPSSPSEPRVLPLSSYALAHGRLADLRDGPYPTTLSGWYGAVFAGEADTTHFGVVHAGTPTLRCSSGTFNLTPGMYFAVPGEMSVGPGAGVLITRHDHRGFFHLGGPIEERGRLRYIDGCTDSLLVPPVLRGDPCLNLLHIPPDTNQTRHTHPSFRVGVVVRGAGACCTPEGTVPLSAGTVFVIRAGGLHSFHTGDHELLLVAYHPDSDFGPTHEDHPMLNRTLIPATLAGTEA